MKHLKIFAFLFLSSIFFSTPLLATPPEALWARSVAIGPDKSEFGSVAVDSIGNIYAAGFIYNNGVFDFGNGVTVSGACGGGILPGNVVLVKYDNNGNTQWARSVLSASEGSFFHRVAVDGSGNIYATGNIFGTDTFDFGNGITASATYTGRGNCLLIKYDASGNAQWANCVLGTDHASFTPLEVDDNRNIYAGGIIKLGPYDFGNGVMLTGNNKVDMITLAKYNDIGEAQWAKKAGDDGGNFSSLASIAVDGFGNVYAAGAIIGIGTYDFGNGVIVNGASSGANIVLAKYDSNGNAQWAKSVVSGTNSRAESVAIDNQNNIYVVGYVTGTGAYNFGNGVIVNGANNGSNVVLVKYNSAGEAQYAKSVVSGTSDSRFKSVVVSNNDDIYTVGYISGTDIFDFGNEITINGTSSGDNVLLVKYDSGGSAQWAKSIVSGANTSRFNAVRVDDGGSLYASGYISGTETFDFGDEVTVSGANSGTNAVVVKYRVGLPPEYPKIVNNDFFIIEGETRVITDVMLSATSTEIEDADLVFSVQDVTHGEFQKNDGGWAATTTFIQQDILDGNVRFIHDGGSTAPSFSIQVSDGTRESYWEYGHVTFTDVNDKPTISGLSSSDNIIGCVSVIDPDITITDEDGMLQGATIQITGNYQAGEDRLSFTNQLGISGSWDQGTGTLELDGGATVANYKTALQSVTYENSSEAPNLNDRTLTWRISDGFEYSDSATSTITLTENNVPEIINNNFTLAEGEAEVINSGMLSATDIETASGDLIFTVQDVTHGEFQKNSGTWTKATSFTQQEIIDGKIRFVHDGDSVSPGFNIQVSDGCLDSNWVSAAVDFIDINDAPVLNKSIDNHTAKIGEIYKFELPQDLFVDEDNSKLSYSAYLSDGDSLPDWLDFNGEKLEFIVDAPKDLAEQDLEIVVEARDSKGAKAQTNFMLSLIKGSDSGLFDGEFMAMLYGVGAMGAVTLIGFGAKALYSWYTGDPEVATEAVSDAVKTLSEEMSVEYNQNF